MYIFVLSCFTNAEVTFCRACLFGRLSAFLPFTSCDIVELKINFTRVLKVSFNFPSREAEVIEFHLKFS